MIRPIPDHGEEIKIIPYQEDQVPAGTLVQLWQIISQEYVTELFWNNGKPMGVEEAIRFFDPAQGRLLLIAYIENPFDLVGLAWFDQLIPQHKSAAHFLFRRKYWGYGRPERVIRQGLDWAFAPPLSLKVVTCQLNVRNSPALGLLHRLGWVKVGEVPQWFARPDGGYDSTVLGFFQSATWTKEHASKYAGV